MFGCWARSICLGIIIRMITMYNLAVRMFHLYSFFGRTCDKNWRRGDSNLNAHVGKQGFLEKNMFQLQNICIPIAWKTYKAITAVFALSFVVDILQQSAQAAGEASGGPVLASTVSESSGQDHAHTAYGQDLYRIRDTLQPDGSPCIPSNLWSKNMTSILESSAFEIGCRDIEVPYWPMSRHNAKDQSRFLDINVIDLGKLFLHW